MWYLFTLKYRESWGVGVEVEGSYGRRWRFSEQAAEYMQACIQYACKTKFFNIHLKTEFTL